MKRFIRTSVSAVLVLSIQVSQAADVKDLMSSCISCHGATGISSNPQYPNLAGQKSAYLLKQMRDFKQGRRKDPVMNAMMRSLSERDMNVLAEYYSNK